jgi:hypothetical protein
VLVLVAAGGMGLCGWLQLRRRRPRRSQARRDRLAPCRGRRAAWARCAPPACRTARWRARWRSRPARPSPTTQSCAPASSSAAAGAPRARRRPPSARNRCARAPLRGPRRSAWQRLAVWVLRSSAQGLWLHAEGSLRACYAHGAGAAAVLRPLSFSGAGVVRGCTAHAGCRFASVAAMCSCKICCIHAHAHACALSLAQSLRRRRLCEDTCAGIFGGAHMHAPGCLPSCLDEMRTRVCSRPIQNQKADMRVSWAGRRRTWSCSTFLVAAGQPSSAPAPASRAPPWGGEQHG